MNNIQIIQYDHPILLEKNEKFHLFEGPLPLGQYEFKIHAIVGQQDKNWPFILPEGKWSIEKVIKIDAHKPNQLTEIKLQIAGDEKTGLPQIQIQPRDENNDK